MLLVMFPYTAGAAQKGESTAPYVIKCSAITLSAAFILSVIYLFFGDYLICLMPNGCKYIEYSKYMPYLTLITSLTSCQVFFTNAEVSAGKFKFLYWLIPLHLIYIAVLHISIKTGIASSLEEMIVFFAVISVLRFIASAINLRAQAKFLRGSCCA
jgi:hypothetical protein